MKEKSAIAMGVVMGILIISSITLGVVIPFTRPDISVSFYPTDMISYPSHTAWLLATVESNEPLDFEVKTSDEVPIDCVVLSTGTCSYLVEIFVHPAENHIDSEIKVNLLAISGNQKFLIGSFSIEVIDWSSQILSEDVLNIRNQFISYIHVNTTFSNINSSTDWEFLGTTPILIVEHYLFKSDFWEMEISRHVMIPPYDWVQVYIRPRNTSVPTWSAKIDSWSLDNASIYEIEPPSEIYR